MEIASALHVMLQLQRLSDGLRRLVSLTEITGMEGEVVQLQEIFRFVRKRTDADGTVHGEFRATSIRPRFMPEFQARGRGDHRAAQRYLAQAMEASPTYHQGAAANLEALKLVAKPPAQISSQTTDTPVQ